MPYRDYAAPGVNVILQRQQVTQATPLTEFYNVFVGNGMTSRSRTLVQTGITADVTNFPEIVMEFPLSGVLSSQMIDQTELTLQTLAVEKDLSGGTATSTTLVAGADYDTVSIQVISADSDVAQVTLTIKNNKIVDTDLVYDITLSATNTDDDFDLRLVSLSDVYYKNDIFGPIVLNENGNEFFNDIAIAAQIAFDMNVQNFYYLEVPRAYGSEATSTDIIDALEKIYYKKNAYRIVPLTFNNDVINAMSALTKSISNPVDRRETVGFSSYDPSEITSFKDMNELVLKVGGFSQSIDNNRISNVFGGESVEYIISGTRYVLPFYFMNVAIACLDSTVGLADPLSEREITVFEKLNGPKFRPVEWNRLARNGVFIVYQNDETDPITIRHQLTTAQSDSAEDQEYSIVKNFDAVTKRLRDRLLPYTGKNNITTGYIEKLDATLTTAIEEVKGLGLARDLKVVSGWSLSTSGTTTNQRNLVTRLSMDAVYPANNLDVYILV